MIDLSKLPYPTVVEQLSFEQIFEEIKQSIISEIPPDKQNDIIQTLSIESELLTKLVQAFAYRELVLRAAINDATRQTMLAFATESNLDHIAARMNVTRFSGEDDETFRLRIQESVEGLSVAGPKKAYEVIAKSVSSEIISVSAISKSLGIVTVTILCNPTQSNPNGIPSQQLINLVHSALNEKEVRPLTDFVEVKSASVSNYSIRASLFLENGPDADIVRAASLSSVISYVNERFGIGKCVTISGIKAAAKVAGVTDVIVLLPTESIINDETQAAKCTSVLIEIGGVMT